MSFFGILKFNRTVVKTIYKICKATVLTTIPPSFILVMSL